MDYTLYTKILLSQIRQDYFRAKIEAEIKDSNERMIDILISSLPEEDRDKIREARVDQLRAEIEMAKMAISQPPKED